MSSVILKNGKKYALVQPVSIETRFERGAQREVMTLIMPAAEASLDAVAADFQNAENTATLKLVQGSEEYAHTEYFIFLGVALKPMVLVAETPATPMQIAPCVSVELGRLTYIEKQLQQLGVQV